MICMFHPCYIKDGAVVYKQRMICMFHPCYIKGGAVIYKQRMICMFHPCYIKGGAQFTSRGCYVCFIHVILKVEHSLQAEDDMYVSSMLY